MGDGTKVDAESVEEAKIFEGCDLSGLGSISGMSLIVGG